MDIDKRRRMIIAGILACRPMPPRDKVQQFCKAHPKKATIQQVVKAFGCKAVALRAFAKEIRNLTNDSLWARWPKACELYAAIPRSEANFTSKLKLEAPTPVRATPAQLNKLRTDINALRKQLKMKLIKRSARYRKEELEAMLDQLKKKVDQSHIEDKFLERKIAPTAVASGAYVNDRVSVAITGHTERGVNKAALKRRRKLERVITGKSAPRTHTGTGEAHPTDANHISLAAIAKELNIDPRVARAKARRNKSSLPTTTGGWTFAIADKAKVIKFLGSK